MFILQNETTTLYNVHISDSCGFQGMAFVLLTTHSVEQVNLICTHSDKILTMPCISTYYLLTLVLKPILCRRVKLSCPGFSGLENPTFQVPGSQSRAHPDIKDSGYLCITQYCWKIVEKDPKFNSLTPQTL